MILKNKTVSEKDLASILGRLENVSHVMTVQGHFLYNIRQMQLVADHKGLNIKLNKRANGSINLQKTRCSIYICDAAEYGLGGFFSHGRASTYIISPELRNRAHINILEYIAQIRASWTDIIEQRIEKQDCILDRR